VGLELSFGDKWFYAAVALGLLDRTPKTNYDEQKPDDFTLADLLLLARVQSMSFSVWASAGRHRKCERCWRRRCSCCCHHSAAASACAWECVYYVVNPMADSTRFFSPLKEKQTTSLGWTNQRKICRLLRIRIWTMERQQKANFRRRSSAGRMFNNNGHRPPWDGTRKTTIDVLVFLAQ